MSYSASKIQNGEIAAIQLEFRPNRCLPAGAPSIMIGQAYTYPGAKDQMPGPARSGGKR